MTVIRSLYIYIKKTQNWLKKILYVQIDPTTPGCRGFYLRYHVSCQKVLEYNSYTHLISLTIYSLWNHSKCSIGNVYIPTKKHSLQVRYAFSEIFTWLQNHKPLVVYCKKKKICHRWIIFITKKKFVRWDRYKCLKPKKEIWFLVKN